MGLLRSGCGTIVRLLSGSRLSRLQVLGVGGSTAEVLRRLDLLGDDFQPLAGEVSRRAHIFPPHRRPCHQYSRMMIAADIDLGPTVREGDSFDVIQRTPQMWPEAGASVRSCGIECDDGVC